MGPRTLTTAEASIQLHFQPLRRWINEQRRYYNSHDPKLPIARIHKLEAIPGFVFNVRASSWNDMYQRLIAFKSEQDQKTVVVVVPTTTTSTPTTTAATPNLILRRWVARQRYNYHHKKGTLMTPDQIQRLEAIGFVFDRTTTNPSASASSTAVVLEPVIMEPTTKMEVEGEVEEEGYEGVEMEEV